LLAFYGDPGGNKLRLLFTIKKPVKTQLKNLLLYFAQFLFILTSLLAGLCLFLLAAIFFINFTFMNPIFQRKILEESGTYIQLDYIVQDNINKLYESGASESKVSETDISGSNFSESNLPGANLPGSVPGENQFKDILDNSYICINNETVKKGVNSFIEGLIKYIRSESRLLPDIYIGRQVLHTLPANTPPADSISSNALPAISIPAEIDKINLGTILLFLNKSYLVDILIVMQQVFQLMEPVPLTLSFLILLFAFIGIIISEKAADILKWWKLHFVSSGIIGLTSILIVFSYSNKYLSSYNYLHILPYSEINVSGVITSYMQIFRMYLVYSMLIYSTICVLISISLPGITGCIKSLYNAIRNYFFVGSEKTPGINLIHIRHISMIIVTLVAVFLIQNIYYLKENYKLNNPAESMARIVNSGAIADVISAKDDMIYSLELKISDEVTGKPISDIKVRVTEIVSTENISSQVISSKVLPSEEAHSGVLPSDDLHSEIAPPEILSSKIMHYDIILSETDYKAETITDNTGTANMILDKGTYRLELSSEEKEYALPEPFLFDIELAGKNSIALRVSHLDTQ